MKYTSTHVSATVQSTSTDRQLIVSCMQFRFRLMLPRKVFYQSRVFLGFCRTNLHKMADAEVICGKWALYEQTGFDEYMKAVGVNFLVRKMITAIMGSSSTVEISKDGDGYKLVTGSPMKSTVTHFRLNEEFDDKLMDGRECRTVFTLNGNVLTQRHFTKDGFETTVEREMTPDSIVATLRYGDAVCVRKFKKAE